MSPLVFSPGNGSDDIIVSIFATHNGSIDGRYMNNQITGSPPNEVGQLVQDTSDWGWSFAADQTGTRNQVSAFSTAELQTSINAGARDTGFILVEVFYQHAQVLNLPVLSSFISNPIGMHVYAVMPLVKAEPTPTPRP